MSQPFFSSRKWIKVWINEWREGTLRWQATDFQRAFWIDLLALAGRSRYPGIVCAGKDMDKIIGYPAAFLAPNSGITNDNIEATLEMFKAKGMVTYQTSVSVQGEALYAVTITNWKKYQSDYEANKKYQRDYRERKKASSPSSQRLTSQLVVRKSLEVDLEVEKDKEEERKPFPTKTVGTMGSEEFREFWNIYPKRVDRQEALRAWVKGLCDGSIGEILAGLEKWKATEQWSDPDKIPYPSTWLNKRRWKEAPETGRKATKNEQARQITKSAIERLRSEVD